MKPRLAVSADGDFSGVGSTTLVVTCEAYDHGVTENAISNPTVAANSGVHVRCASSDAVPIELSSVRVCSPGPGDPDPTITCDGFSPVTMYDAADLSSASATFLVHPSAADDRVAFFTPAPRVIENAETVFIETLVRRDAPTRSDEENGGGLLRIKIAAGSGSSSSAGGGTPAVVAPVVGAVAGLLLVAAVVLGIAMYFARRRKADLRAIAPAEENVRRGGEKEIVRRGGKSTGVPGPQTRRAASENRAAVPPKGDTGSITATTAAVPDLLERGKSAARTPTEDGPPSFENKARRNRKVHRPPPPLFSG